jgi:hypothetical protein
MPDPWYGRADTLDEEQTKIIEEACNCAGVRETDYGAALLRYLAVHSEPGFKKYRTAQAINATAFGKRSTGPPNLPAYLKKLQRCLDKFFDDEGSGFERRIRIQFSEPGQKRNPNQYAVDYPLNHGQGWYTRLFWKNYLPTRVPTLIAYGVPLFESNDDYDVFTRKTWCNQDHEIKDQEMACYPFVALGEVLAMMDIIAWLTGKGVKVTYTGYSRKHDASDVLQDAAEANGVWLGTASVNGVLHGYQRYKPFPFILGNEDITEHQDSLEGPVIETYIDRTIIKGETGMAHVLVSRRPGKRTKTITMIASNHGRAIQRMGQLLTRESEIKQLFETQALTSLTELPNEFQLLFEVEIHAKESVPGAWKLIRWWIPTLLK